MKKFFSLISVAAVLGVGALSAQSTDVVLPGSEKSSRKDYIVTVDGAAGKDSSDKTRNEVLNELAYKLPKGSYEVTNIYDTVMNGFAISIDSSLSNYVSAISGVSSVEESHTYAAPSTETSGTATTSTASDDVVVKGKLTNYSAQSVHADDDAISAAIKDVTGTSGTTQGGKGIKIGIIDTGLYLNQLEGSSAREAAKATAAKDSSPYTLSNAAFNDLTSDNLDADAITADNIKTLTTTAGKFIDNKIAYTSDYADKDNNVDPTGGSAGEHGTHVASMAAANGLDFKGIAPNAQLAILKVFGNVGGGASDTSIIAALNDAAKLKLDVVNLSLGTDLIDYDDTVSDATYQAIVGANAAGTIVNFAAGNAGKSSFSGTKGYADWTTDTVETGVLGSSANFDETCNIVAASNPDKAFYSSIMTIGDTAISYDDQVINKTGSSLHYDEPHALTDLLGSETSGTFNYVRIGGNGAESDYTDDIKSKITAGKNIAVVNRGVTTFTSKVQNAEAAGAKAVIMINNDPSMSFNFSFDFGSYNPSIPVVLVYKSMNSIFGAAGNTGSFTLGVNTVRDARDGRVIASFSSDGPSYNLDIDPTLAAPGKQTIGAVSALTKGTNSSLYGYDNYDGTSMATPNLTGSIALALGEKKPANSGALASSSDDNYTSYKKNVSSIAMASANQLLDTTKATVTSPRMQGAGQIDVRNLLSTDTYITYNNQDTGDFTNTTESKVELKNTGTLQVDLATSTQSYISFSYTIHNDSSTSRTYDPSLSVMIPQLRVQETQAEYDGSASETKIDIAENLPSTITQSVNDDLVTTVAAVNSDSSDHVTVAANSTTTGTVKVEIDNLQFTKAWDDAKNADFTGTLQEYVNKYFSDAGGTYVEGYLNLSEVGVTENDAAVSHKLSIPYMGFYGNYTIGAAVEPLNTDKEAGHLYNSEMIDAYVKNLSNATYKKANAYTGSSLSACSASKADDYANISNMNTSAVADGTNYLSTSNPSNDGKVYAGATNKSDALIASFFVNRSISSATWSISSGSTVKTHGDIDDIYSGYNYGTAYGLVKSWLSTGDSGYVMHRGYAKISLKTLDEGEYTLKFSFTLRGTGTTQTISKTLVIDKTAPTLVSATVTTSDDKKYLTLVTKGADSQLTVGGIGYVPNSSDGELYTYKVKLTDKILEAGTLTATIEDSAHNQSNLIINPNDLTFVAGSSEFTKSMMFVATLVNSGNGSYTFTTEVTDLKGNTLTLKKDYTLYIQLATSLDVNTLAVTVDGADTTYTYDATTGILAVAMPAGSGSITLNSAPSNITPSGTSSSSSATSSSSSSDTTKKGCGGSIAAATSIAGAALLMGLGLIIKNKKDKKSEK